MTAPALDTSAITALIADATAAPSLHNAQPWKFRFHRGSGTLRLYADLERELPKTDPDNRGLRLGCGAALFNLRVAAVAAGRDPAVRLLPDDSDPMLLAEVDLTGSAPPDDPLAVLQPAIHRRHTSRAPFLEDDIPDVLRDGLCVAARLEGCRLVFPETWHVQAVLDLVHDAECCEAWAPDVRNETAHWVRTEPASETSASDGIPAEALGPGQWGASSPVRDLTVGRTVAGRDWAPFEKCPHLALLGTAHDRPVDWLWAGQALERVWLQATLDGLVASLTSQPLEWPEFRWAVRDPASAMAYVQMVIRLGYGPEGHPTPRRPVTEVLDIV
ncbi:Acg family FMN-binding oxidoreductase [Streptomyces gibsoniae]|uniref:Nitroreductase n=1 Tax=Streptomyces gibsoniae TaxID=3075529 RepID=A0ABU2U2I9_9ACTN|nr:nitroreductase [Streptomyces sp. DSM 41699]MDT0467394.1 nitroreductase [Streptomyces sp. DSM 41699]